MTEGYRVIIIAQQGSVVGEFCVGRGTVRAAVAVLLVAALVPLAVGVALAKTGIGRAPQSAADRGETPALGPLMTSGVEPAREVLERGIAQRGRRLLEGVRLQPDPGPEPCAPGMVLVEGAYCPVIHQRCLRFADPEGSSLHSQRCAEFESPTRCLSPRREQVRYCIDIDERAEQGGALPKTRLTAAEAGQACQGAGKRLCTEKEWTFACEGDSIAPYPYGFERDSKLCNADQTDLVAPDGSLVDRRARPGSHPQCASSFGVRDLTGNVEEYVALDSDSGRIVRKGAYWQPGANTCRTSQAHPEPDYQGIELGFRCCSDAESSGASAR